MRQKLILIDEFFMLLSICLSNQNSILGAWLAEEAMANREEVCEILPFILQLANETFESQKLSKVNIYIY